MFIATGPHSKISRSVRRETRQRNLRRRQPKRLRSYRAAEQRKDRPTINISPLWGEATTAVLLHLQTEFAKNKSPSVLNKTFRAFLSHP